MKKVEIREKYNSQDENESDKEDDGYNYIAEVMAKQEEEIKTRKEGKSAGGDAKAKVE